MKVEFSHECEIAAYLFVLQGFNVCSSSRL